MSAKVEDEIVRLCCDRGENHVVVVIVDEDGGSATIVVDKWVGGECFPAGGQATVVKGDGTVVRYRLTYDRWRGWVLWFCWSWDPANPEGD